ncbi:hypothetical protein CKO38_09230 [Rhodospirillum rubrum]|uniref:histidine phosphotransferase family protein n=1 Tax=Rhodospirillum rubrum TaxID=1085 RepID=UPI001904E2B8|nr:histidine phosphotransferase family protein [Rhodospirillum rubrum]MBK1664902.1 hypothetical protein [Rhodospirillum rubrum]MBK1676850.1 hypothetical protein [Rhodospirillum rubrum]
MSDTPFSPHSFPASALASPDSAEDEAEDLDLALMLCTRLCHDLAGSIGAVNTGAELLEEEGEAFDPETLALLADSARGAALRLKVLRMAMGLVRGRQPTLAEAAEGLGGLLAASGRRFALGDPAMGDPGAPTVQLLVNLAMVAADVWPKAAEITLGATEDGYGVWARGAAGPPGAPWDRVLAVRGDAADPRTVQAWLTKRLAARLGMAILIPSSQAGTLLLTRR